MARTGSGKTAAFLIPTIAKLKEHSTRVGIRCVVISPTRELTMQSYQMCRQLSRYMNLKMTALTGGEGLNQEFDALSQNPDIVFATPGRLMHLILELDITMASVETLVIDEADRMFEMGVTEQLMLIIGKMVNPNRQTLLFSATMPDDLANFTKVGLNNPVLVKLDKELRIPETLQMDFFILRNEDKDAILINFLRSIQKKLTIVFVATKHHVEYLEYLTQAAKINSVGMYGKMDQTARNDIMAMFRKKKRHVLIVTDLAARGLDIPMLDVVIHYNFSDTPKLFVHRSGRVARMGRPGREISLEKSETSVSNYGRISEEITRLAQEDLRQVLESSVDEMELAKKAQTMKNAVKQYNRSRQAASIASTKRCNEIDINALHYQYAGQDAQDLNTFMQRMRNYRPGRTVQEPVKRRKISDDLPPEPIVAPPEPAGGKRSKHYISYENTGFFDTELSQITGQIPLDEAGEMTRVWKNKWNASKKKFITQDFDENGKLYKGLKTDGKVKKLYKKWKQHSNKRIQKEGEEEVVASKQVRKADYRSRNKKKNRKRTVQ